LRPDEQDTVDDWSNIPFTTLDVQFEPILNWSLFWDYGQVHDTQLPRFIDWCLVIYTLVLHN